MGATLLRSAGTLTIEGDVEIYDEDGEFGGEGEGEEGEEGEGDLPFEQQVGVRPGGKEGGREGGREGGQEGLQTNGWRNAPV
jgi:hypothetical protein